MKIEISICKGCGNEKPIVNRTHWLCDTCNRSRLDNQKSSEFKKTKLSSYLKMSTKQKENLMALTEVYAQIAKEREHVCVGCGSKNMLSHSHIIPRSRRKDLELEKKNIVYHCLTCHSIWEHGTLKEKAGLHNFDEMMEYINEVDIEYYNLLISKWER